MPTDNSHFHQQSERHILDPKKYNRFSSFFEKLLLIYSSMWGYVDKSTTLKFQGYHERYLKIYLEFEMEKIFLYN